MLAEVAATAAGLRMGRGARAAYGSGLASTGRSCEIWTLKKSAAEKTEECNGSDTYNQSNQATYTSRHLPKWESLRNKKFNMVNYTILLSQSMTQRIILTASNHVAF